VDKEILCTTIAFCFGQCLMQKDVTLRCAGSKRIYL